MDPSLVTSHEELRGASLHTLHVSRVAASDEGMFTCVATNDLGAQARNWSLTVARGAMHAFDSLSVARGSIHTFLLLLISWAGPSSFSSYQVGEVQVGDMGVPPNWNNGSVARISANLTGWLRPRVPSRRDLTSPDLTIASSHIALDSEWRTLTTVRIYIFTVVRCIKKYIYVARKFIMVGFIPV